MAYCRNFGNLISQVSESLDSIALVGGHIFEPELEVLKYKDLTHYGVEFDLRVKTELFDLNISQIVDKNYDLVLCSQVLEHVYDVKQATENLAKLVRQGGSCGLHARPRIMLMVLLSISLRVTLLN